MVQPKDVLDTLVSISFENTDYFEWGNNCRKLDFTPECTQNVIDHYETEPIVQENKDLFWAGYYSKKENK